VAPQLSEGPRIIVQQEVLGWIATRIIDIYLSLATLFGRQCEIEETEQAVEYGDEAHTLHRVQI
jgi:hypothetical protein